MKNRSFLKNAAVISLGGLAAKVIGALYRFPLTGLLGGYGMGLYQMAYPFFLVLLTFSSTGIPTALARMIARERAQGRDTGTVRTALNLFALLGLVGSLLMCLLAPYMSALQGDPALKNCYYALAPSVFLVALIAVLRGYFQGKSDMVPTAVSEIAEQLFKACAGLYFAYKFSFDPALAVAFTLFAVTLSEIFALFCLFVRYRAEGGRKLLSVRRTTGREILFAALPVMAAASLLPLSGMADSVIIVRLLSRHTDRAVALYGLFAGGAVTLAHLPATLSYGLAVSSVPSVSRAFARGDEEEGRRRALRALGLSLVLSVPCTLALFFFAEPITRLLYSGLSAEDFSVLVRLVRLTAVSAITVSAVDILAACLAGMGRARRAAVSMLVAIVIKITLQVVLVSNPALSVSGAAIAANACYLVAFSLDLYYTVSEKTRTRKEYDHGHRIGDGTQGFDAQGAGDDAECGRSAPAHGNAPLRRGAKKPRYSV